MFQYQFGWYGLSRIASRTRTNPSSGRPRPISSLRVLDHDEIVVRIERHGALDVVKSAVVMPREEVGDRKRQMRLGILVVERKRRLADLDHARPGRPSDISQNQS